MLTFLTFICKFLLGSLVLAGCIAGLGASILSLGDDK